MNEGTPSDTVAPDADSPTKPLGEVIAINEGLIKDHLDKVVVKTVEETLNALLDAEADELCGAKLTFEPHCAPESFGCKSSCLGGV